MIQINLSEEIRGCNLCDTKNYESKMINPKNAKENIYELVIISDMGAGQRIALCKNHLIELQKIINEKLSEI